MQVFYYDIDVLFRFNLEIMFEEIIWLVVWFCKDWMIDNVVVPVATVYGLAKEYEYLKYSINGYLTGFVLHR